MELKNKKAQAPKSTIMLVGISFLPNPGNPWRGKFRFKHCLYTFLKLIIKPIVLKSCKRLKMIFFNTSVKKLVWKIFVNLRKNMLNSNKKLIKKGIFV